MSIATEDQGSAGITEERARAVADRLQSVTRAVASVVLGQEDCVRQLVAGLLADGHVLLEGVPGVAKTLLARALSSTVGLSFTRIQFTPDLMPADLTGMRIWNGEKRAWELHKGPIFTDVLLADEVNRTPPKTQAALLEAMEERQVTLDGTPHDLGDAFFVVATQNPLEFEGTYPLPEAQADRFLMKILVDYPTASAELELLGRGARHRDQLPPVVLTREDLGKLRAVVGQVRVDESVRRYVLALLQATRSSAALRLGASPRAGLMWLRVAQALALMEGRPFVLPDDVKAAALPVLRHRLMLSTDAELDGKSIPQILAGMLSTVPVVVQV